MVGFIIKKFAKYLSILLYYLISVRTAGGVHETGTQRHPIKVWVTSNLLSFFLCFFFTTFLSKDIQARPFRHVANCIRLLLPQAHHISYPYVPTTCNALRKKTSHSVFVAVPPPTMRGVTPPTVGRRIRG
jgi:hypothetical protein